MLIFLFQSCNLPSKGLFWIHIISLRVGNDLSHDTCWYGPVMAPSSTITQGQLPNSVGSLRANSWFLSNDAQAIFSHSDRENPSQPQHSEPGFSARFNTTRLDHRDRRSSKVRFATSQTEVPLGCDRERIEREPDFQLSRGAGTGNIPMGSVTRRWISVGAEGGSPRGQPPVREAQPAVASDGIARLDPMVAAGFGAADPNTVVLDRELQCDPGAAPVMDGGYSQAPKLAHYREADSGRDAGVHRGGDRRHARAMDGFGLRVNHLKSTFNAKSLRTSTLVTTMTALTLRRDILTCCRLENPSREWIRRAPNR